MKHKSQPHKKRVPKQLLIRLFVSMILVLAGLYLFGLKNSLFLKTKERVNFVVYGSNTVVYSVDTSGQIHYAIQLPADAKIQVPGGYGTYRVGALGKLVSLEKKPAIFQRAFTAATSIFIDYYFYTSDSSVHYGRGVPADVPFVTIPELLQAHSNVGFFDRIYLAMLMSNENKRDFTVINMQEGTAFQKKYRGYFYINKYRKEQKNVQIQYSDRYVNAESISPILEGNGIRVSDIGKTTEDVKRCEVWEQTSEYSETARDMAEFFGCRLKNRETGVYDIILLLGPLEHEWEAL